MLGEGEESNGFSRAFYTSQLYPAVERGPGMARDHQTKQVGWSRTGRFKMTLLDQYLGQLSLAVHFVNCFGTRQKSSFIAYIMMFDHV